MSLRTNKGKDFSLKTKDVIRYLIKNCCLLAQGQVEAGTQRGWVQEGDCWEKGMVDKIQKRLSNFKTQKS